MPTHALAFMVDRTRSLPPVRQPDSSRETSSRGRTTGTRAGTCTATTKPLRRGAAGPCVVLVPLLLDVVWIEPGRTDDELAHTSRAREGGGGRRSCEESRTSYVGEG